MYMCSARRVETCRKNQTYLNRTLIKQAVMKNFSSNKQKIHPARLLIYLVNKQAGGIFSNPAHFLDLLVY